jgi:NAD+ diphosphatase
LTEPADGAAASPGSGTGPRRPLGPLALARTTIDRAALHRDDDAWLAAAWAAPGTRVLVVQHGQALVRFGDDRAHLVLLPTGRAPDGTRLLLGVDQDGNAYFGVMAALPTGDPAALGTGDHDRAQPAGLRQAGALLDDRDAGLLTQAVGLANWHETHTHCPRCGSLTDPVHSGHARVCRNDGSEHFPRTDPAAIMLVTDPDDRILLGRGPKWGERRMSILAGFVEPGESAEQTVIREVAEETGIVVGDVRYLGSQPWPLPQSLMLGFWAKAAGGQRIQVDGEEIIEAQWFSRDELRQAIAAGELGLPASVSIAHRIIEAWYGAELPAGLISPFSRPQPASS